MAEKHRSGDAAEKNAHGGRRAEMLKGHRYRDEREGPVYR
jgi:hypothetical protein